MTESRADMMEAVDAAIGWHLRLPEATRDEWHAFVEWLEANPAHAAAYDRLTLDDAMLAPSLEERPVASVPVAANDAGDVSERRWRFGLWAGGAMAAALALTVALPMSGDDTDFMVETQPGARKQVAFADGTRVTLNGGSRVRFDRADSRFAELVAGEAIFEVRHDAARPFTVKSGALTLRDLGTVFNVVRNERRMALEVSEGAVMFEPEGQALTVRPGVALKIDEHSRRVEFSRVAPADVGGWRRGRLNFGNERLADAAAALSRVTGAPVTVSPALAELPFTGTLTIDRDAGATVRRLARLTGNTARRHAGGWTIESGEHARD